MNGDNHNERSSCSMNDPEIFVVDDNDMVVELVENILRIDHYRSRVFTDPEEALKCFTEAEEKPPLLITDFVMDRLNGMELIQKCKKLHQPLRTILYSGNVGQECMEGYHVAPDHFLPKPFVPKDLLALVDGLMKPSRSD